MTEEPGAGNIVRPLWDLIGPPVVTGLVIGVLLVVLFAVLWRGKE